MLSELLQSILADNIINWLAHDYGYLFNRNFL